VKIRLSEIVSLRLSIYSSLCVHVSWQDQLGYLILNSCRLSFSLTPSCLQAFNRRLVLGSLFVDIGLAVVALLVNLVGEGVSSSLGSGTKAGVAVFGNILVCLLGGSGGGAGDGLLDVVDCVLDGIHCEG